MTRAAELATAALTLLAFRSVGALIRAARHLDRFLDPPDHPERRHTWQQTGHVP